MTALLHFGREARGVWDGAQVEEPQLLADELRHRPARSTSASEARHLGATSHQLESTNSGIQWDIK